jgi:hypothetical protein
MISRLNPVQSGARERMLWPFDLLRTQLAQSAHSVFIAGAVWMHTSRAGPGCSAVVGRLRFPQAGAFDMIDDKSASPAFLDVH